MIRLKCRLVQWNLAVLGLLGCLAEAANAPGPEPSGHWEGAVTLPATSLGIRVDLEQGDAGAWQGSIDIPVQGLRGFKLGSVAVDGANVRFAMPGIPGDPGFAGRLAADGKSLSGDFTQGGQTFPFKLERKPRPAATTGETPSRGVPGQGLVGYWQGSLKPAPVIELRLVL